MQPFPSGQVAGQETRTTESQGSRKEPSENGQKSRTNTRARKPGQLSGQDFRKKDRKALDLYFFPVSFIPADNWKPVQGRRPISDNPPERSRTDTRASLPADTGSL